LAAIVTEINKFNKIFLYFIPLPAIPKTQYLGAVIPTTPK
jgi:hypothetical protein